MSAFVGSNTGIPIPHAGVPVAGTDAVQTLTIGGTPTGGTFRLKYENLISPPIEWSATTQTLLDNVQDALDVVPSLGDDEVTVAEGSLSSGVGTVTITFDGDLLAKLAVPVITVETNDLTGTSPTVAVAITTPGVTATGRKSKTGKLLIDTVNGDLYINQGEFPEPDFVLVGPLEGEI